MSAKMIRTLKVFSLMFALLVRLAALTGVASAAGLEHDGHGDSGGHGQGLAFGEPAEARDATRTIAVMMHDTSFQPERIRIEVGETVRFVVSNGGRLVHEFNVGTAAMHAEHQKQMAMMVDHGMLEADKINHGMLSEAMGGGQMSGSMMMHDDPNSVLLEPGRTGEVVLKFTKATNLEFACNVPGHYEAGMVGTIDVTP